jgi:hypothetical protein
MSVISNIHTATPYDAKTTKPFEGQRLVVTIAKKDKDGNYGPHLQVTQATSIPTLMRADIDFSLASVQDACVDYFKTIQNAIISDRIKEGHKEVRTQDLSASAIIDYLSSESVGDKWDSERVAQWFTDYVAVPFTEKLIENGCDDSQINVKLAVTGKRFSEALSSRAKIPTQVAEALTRVLKLSTDSDGVVYKRFYAKLNPPTVADVLDIGF